MSHVDHNLPAPSFTNLFEEDTCADRLFRHWMGKGAYDGLRGKLVQMGKNAADATALSARADQQSPVLQSYDPTGLRVDRVVYHPDYHALEDLSFGAGIVGLKYDPSFLANHRSIRHLTGFALGYLFSQTEPSLFCPVCMTDGVGRVLERHGNSAVARETIAHLSSTDRKERWRGAMFLTEKQGGSDVGQNTATARREGGRWLLDGDKWFCSNVDAEAVLALARMPGGPAGTKGLGLFLVLRHLPGNNGQTIRIHRIKEKLGVRSMPTGEISFEATEAQLIGGIGAGFKQMAEMLNLSRLYNAIASMGGARRAILEALAYGAERRAFGQLLWDLPLWRSNMADLQAEFLGMLVLVFETVRTLDAADCGNREAERLLRLLTPMSKALSGKFAVFAVSECMEAIGGNAYIEESIVPRLLRDCQVLPIWEGTTNILALDGLRAIQKLSSHEALCQRITEAIEKAISAGIDDKLVSAVKNRLKKDLVTLTSLANRSSEDQQRSSRGWIESAGRTTSLALLLELAQDSSLREPCLAAIQRMLARPFATAPVSGCDMVDLRETEEPLLRAGYRR